MKTIITNETDNKIVINGQARQEKLDTRNYIYLFGASQNNLKNVDLILPKYKLIVVTGVSGSGKSSLIVDTLYAEGHRKYVESLSTYVRQFVARVAKPNLAHSAGLSPAMLLEQRKATQSRNSTVASITEIYSLLRLLFATIGKTFSPITGREIKCDNVQTVTEYITSIPEGKRVYILTKYEGFRSKKSVKEFLEKLLQQGFSRILVGDEPMHIEDVLEQKLWYGLKKIYPIIYRLKTKKEYSYSDLDNIADALETAFHEGNGKVIIYIQGERFEEFSDKFEEKGITYTKPTPSFFNNNNSLGACPVCKGTGQALGPLEELIVPDTSLSLEEFAIIPYLKAPMMQEQLLKFAPKYNIRTNVPYYSLTPEEKHIIWFGNEDIIGIYDFFTKGLARRHITNSYEYIGKGTCMECKGSGIRKEALYVKINKKDIADVLSMTIENAYEWFNNLKLTEYEKEVAKQILESITTRLKFLIDVGVSYLTLNRKIKTLSGGELQRVKLASILGNPLVGTMYILDEPTIGLHSRDTHRLINVLKSLRDLGNTVIVIEHDEQVIENADYVVDVGPQAGEKGGEIVFAGKYEDFIKSSSDTALYMKDEKRRSYRNKNRRAKGWIKLTGARKHNIKNIDVEFPLGVMSVIVGVSGSGKSTLIEEILYPAINDKLGNNYWNKQKGKVYRSIEFPENLLQDVVFVNQYTLSRSSRSTPATYIGAFDYIRKLFASLPDAHGIGEYAFSFNTSGGRCEKCEGEGYITIEMQFLPDLKLVCPECNGKRYQNFILEIKYEGHSIYDILNLSVDEAVELFSRKNSPTNRKIIERLKLLQEVGMGYIRLGQNTTTLSGGEAQRLKLASFLQEKKDPTLFIFDEPTTGLHFQDVEILLQAFEKLLNKGHSVMVIEHNLDVIANADYIIELGPDSGEKGGKVIFKGTPRQLAKKSAKSSPTAPFLKNKFS